jgi:predicted hotdog family 3-hydroxylacyl-ACP dehydratase
MRDGGYLRREIPLYALPHRPPARMVTHVLYGSDSEITCEAVVPLDSPFAEGGRCASWVTVEIAAQAAAVLEFLSSGAEAGGAGRSRAGYLVRIRSATFSVCEFRAGVPLEARVVRVGAAPPLAVFEATVGLDGLEIMRGRLSAYLGAPSEAGGPVQALLKQNH